MSRSIGIRVYKGDELVDTHVFDRDIIKIGRLASAHLRLEDTKVSRIHAVIDITGANQEVSIIDMGSAEGTRVNGDKVSRVRLNHGDEVGLGDSRLVVVLEEDEVAALGAGGGEAAAEAEAPAAEGGIPGLPTSMEAGETQVLQAPEAPATSEPEPEPEQTAISAADEEELRSLEVPDQQSNVFETSNDFQAEVAEVDLDAEGGFFSSDESKPAAAEPAAPAQAQPPPRPMSAHIPAPPLVAAQPPMGAAAPLPPIPEDAITPENRHLEISVRWGSDVVELKRLRGVPKYVIGGGDEADFFMPIQDVCSGSQFDLVRQREGGSEWVVRFTQKMSGTVRRGDDVKPLSESGAMQDGDGMALTITDGMEVTISFGYFTIELRNVSRSRAIPIPPFLDMFLINTTLVTLFSWASLMSVLLLMPTGLGDDDDDLFSNTNQFQTLLLKPPPKDNSFLQKLKGKSEMKQAAKEDKGQAGKKTAKENKKNRASFKAKDDKPTDEQIVASKLKQLFGDSGNQGIAALFGADVSGGELQTLLGGISGTKAGESYGVGGLGLRGSGPGGGGTGVATMGIGAVGTRGRGSGDAAYGSGEGGLGAKGDRDIRVNMGKPLVYGSLDKEIIRRVVRENSAQIRYCYERELTRNPGIFGKIVMKWVITGTGSVRQATTVETQMKNKAVESCLASRIKGWRFPKPKGGGIVIVTYPFVFKKSG